jgi:hypothetical protein
MKNEISQITQQLFHKESLDQLSDEELQSFLSKYPYAAPARFLLARKKFDAGGGDAHNDVVTAGLYFNNPLWFHSQLTSRGETTETEIQRQETEAETPAPDDAAGEDKKEDIAQPPADADSPIIFQSYHTIDYFASQGIRLQQADLTKDKLGQQLKSFTEWLRSMKKLPATESPAAGGEDDNRQQHVIASAANSIEEKEVLTEAMAEVWAKQGNTSRAIETYNKLSLLNPTKSAYFAAKIDQIK